MLCLLLALAAAPVAAQTPLRPDADPRIVSLATDAQLRPDQDFDTPAPDANDNGSGTALTMELARALATSGLEFDATLVFALWAGEAQGLMGAHVHAQPRVGRQPSGYDATLQWTASPGAAAYRIYWRDTWSNDRQHSQLVGHVSEFTLRSVSIDDSGAMIRLFRVIVPVADIARARTFYGTLLEQEGRTVSPGRHYFGCGGTILACFDPRADGDPWAATPNPDHIYFSVEDLEATLERAAGASATVTKPIETQPWGERSFYCSDPFGNKLCFVDSTTLFTAGLI